MVKKEFLIGVVFLGFIFLFAGNVLGLACEVKDICNPNQIVMALSSNSNAHGEDTRSGSGDYAKKICCDFEGTSSCVGGNDVGVSLSSTLNAHGELTGGVGGYSNNICFGAMECISGSAVDCSSGGYDLEIVSLPDVTNSHFGSFNEYNNKICCKWGANAYWADVEDSTIVKQVAAVGSKVVLVLNNSGLDIGTGVFNNFKIFENDLLVDDNIPGASSIVGDTVPFEGTRSLLSGEWTITQEDYDIGGDSNEFYFNANGIESPYLNIVELDEGVTYCDGFTDEVVCSSCSGLSCIPAYNGKNNFLIQKYGAGCGASVPGDENYKFNCFCQWNSDTGVCGSSTSVVSTIDTTVSLHCKNNVQDDPEEDGIDCGGADCGICGADGRAIPHCVDNIMNEGETGLDCGGTECGLCSYSISLPKVGACEYVSLGTDDCADGFLTYEWVGDWTWGSNNGFSSTNNPFSNDPADYVDVGGTFYYDRSKISENCVGGTNVITCPAQVQLSFFGFFGFLGSLILIAIIYLSLIFRKNN